LPQNPSVSESDPPPPTERTIPILPCRSIDDVLAFYRALGFAVTYQQARPNTYAVVVRGGIELQFFVLKELDPAASYSTCYVLVGDVDGLYESFRAGLAAAFGRVPSRGVPRIGPLRDMSYGVRQFIVVDPGGNYIRIGQPIATKPALTVETDGRLERALEAAITLADSRSDAAAAAKVLDSAFRDDPPLAGSVAVRALILRADVAFRMGDPAAARARLEDATTIDVPAAEREALGDDLRRAEELEEALRLS
jgi:catechol 2,3-dioxygenase-like lactoylglutathione lyase family enzyme